MSPDQHNMRLVIERHVDQTLVTVHLPDSLIKEDVTLRLQRAMVCAMGEKLPQDTRLNPLTPL